MYLAQDVINPTFLDSLGKVGPFGLLCFVVIAFIYLVIKLNGNSAKTTVVQDKLTDVQSKVVENKASDNQNFIDAISNLTKIVMSQQSRMDTYDQSFAAMVAGLERQNVLLTDIKGIQDSGNSYTVKLHDAIVNSVNDTSSALSVISDHLGKQVQSVEATINARLDTLPERVASRVIAGAATSHSELKQTIIERTKSIEDLFTKVTRENEDLTEIVKLRDDTIVALNAEIIRLKTPPAPDDKPPTPILEIDPTTGEALKRNAA